MNLLLAIVILAVLSSVSGPAFISINAGWPKDTIRDRSEICAG